MAEQPPYAPNVVNQTVQYGGATWKGNPGTGWSLEGSGGDTPSSTTSPINTQSVLQNATQIQDFYKKQNEPVISATLATKAPLEQRYKDLLASIKGNQQIAENRQTVVTNNELGKRGITGSSTLAGQELTNALNPITSQYTGMYKDTANQENIDIANIDKAIASLMAGNPEGAISTSAGLVSSQASLDAAAKQAAIDNALKQTAANKIDTSIIEAGGRKLLINNQTGKTIQDLGSSTSGGGLGIDALIAALGGSNNSTKKSYTSQDVDEYVQKYGIQAAIDSGIVGPNQYK